MKSMRRQLGRPCTAAFLLALVRGLSATYRYRWTGKRELFHRLEKGERVLLCLWHQQFFPPIAKFPEFAPFNPCLMISRSEDGQIIANVAKLSKWTPVRGSSSSGGKTAMDGIIQRMRDGDLGGHILDGPTGPFGKVKPGAVRIAQQTGAKMIPIVMVPTRAWTFGSWDRFLVPKPLSRIEMRVLAPIEPPAPDATEAEFEAVRRDLETRMQAYLV